MATFTQIYYHIVFSTKNRERVLKAENREKLFRYMWGILKNYRCRPYRINGTEDHLHILCHLHPTKSLSSLIKDIKTGSGEWIRENTVFPKFSFWQEGYAAFTLSAKDKEAVMQYIIDQENHNKRVSFEEELKRLLAEAGISFEEKYLL